MEKYLFVIWGEESLFEFEKLFELKLDLETEQGSHEFKSLMKSLFSFGYRYNIAWASILFDF